MDEAKAKYSNFLCQELLGRNFQILGKKRPLLLSSVKSRDSKEAIFGSGREFPDEFHLGISTSSEGKEQCFQIFADGHLESDPR